jgi:hypothetical protein
MRTFHYLPPGTEEQRAFALQFMLTLVSIGIALFLAWKTPEPVLRGLCFGAVGALLYTLVRSAWNLELKARRAQVAEIGVAEDGLHWRDEKDHETFVAWIDISEVGISGGRLTIEWKGGKLIVGARELEEGMDLIRAVHNARERALGRFTPPTNFIPLDSL